MERRREPRIDTSQTVRLVLLSGEERACLGRTIDFSGRGLKLKLADPLPVNAAVKVHLEDALLLGEVCYCVADEPGYLVGIEIDQILSGLSDLARLNAKLLLHAGCGEQRRDSLQECGIPDLAEDQDTAGGRYQQR